MCPCSLTFSITCDGFGVGFFGLFLRISHKLSSIFQELPSYISAHIMDEFQNLVWKIGSTQVFLLQHLEPDCRKAVVCRMLMLVRK